jgi:sec-independent protein translocase protein TatC
MSFIDHLEELRWHLIRSVIAIAIGCIIVLIFAKDIVDGILLAPTRR